MISTDIYSSTSFSNDDSNDTKMFNENAENSSTIVLQGAMDLDDKVTNVCLTDKQLCWCLSGLNFMNLFCRIIFRFCFLDSKYFIF